LKVNPLQFILAIAGGVFVSFIFMSLFQSLGPRLIAFESLKEGANSREFMAYVNGLPTKAFLYMGLTYALSSFFGSYVAARIPKSKKKEAGVSVTLFIVVLAVFFFISLPHPILFSILSCVGILILGYLGMRVGTRVS